MIIFFGDTPLYLALLGKNYDIAEALVECGASIDFEDDSGIPLLHRFVTLKDSDAIKFLVEHGSEALSKPNEDGLTPYQQAILDNEVELLPVLCPDGNAPPASVQFAMTADSPEAIKALSGLGADLDAFVNGDTFLMIAAASNSVDELEALIESGASLDLQSPEDGQTALHRAVIAGNKECIECLLHHGARPDIKDNDQKTPKDYVDNDKEDIVKLFGETSSGSSCCILI